MVAGFLALDNIPVERSLFSIVITSGTSLLYGLNGPVSESNYLAF